jgi:hypothetical protein
MNFRGTRSLPFGQADSLLYSLLRKLRRTYLPGMGISIMLSLPISLRLELVSYQSAGLAVR